MKHNIGIIKKNILNKKALKESICKFSFTNFMIYALRALFLIILIGSIGKLIYFFMYSFSAESIGVILIYLLLSALLYIGIKKNIKMKNMFWIILLVGFILRVIWAFSIDTVPVSDFEQVYNAALKINQGDYSYLKGTFYFGRFPHFIMFILYISKMIDLFSSNVLTYLKWVNVFFSTSTIIFIYFICKEVFKKDKNKIIIGTFLSAVIPSSISYTSVYCSENLAIPFYLASIYVFILVMNKKKNEKFLILCGGLLIGGHLLRMIGQIVIIAYIMYILIYSGFKNINKIKCTMYLLVAFIIPLILTSNLLIHFKVTDRKLWDGSEPVVTCFLRGSNIESFGRWNKEDAEFTFANIDNREFLEKECKNIIIDRYTNTPKAKLTTFFIGKFAMQWMNGDDGGVFWCESSIIDENLKDKVYNKANIGFQLFYIVILIFIIKGLFNKSQFHLNKIINIFYIIFCGYGLTFLMIESQERYAYIINYIFCIMPLIGISCLDYKLDRTHY